MRWVSGMNNPGMFIDSHHFQFSSVKLRTDRDKHVRILWENIEMGREDQFAR